MLIFIYAKHCNQTFTRFATSEVLLHSFDCNTIFFRKRLKNNPNKHRLVTYQFLCYWEWNEIAFQNWQIKKKQINIHFPCRKKNVFTISVNVFASILHGPSISGEPSWTSYINPKEVYSRCLNQRKSQTTKCWFSRNIQFSIIAYLKKNQKTKRNFHYFLQIFLHFSRRLKIERVNMLI